MKLPVIKLSDQTKDQLSNAFFGTLGVILLISIAQSFSRIFYRELGAGRALIHMTVSLLGLWGLLRAFQLSPQECGITRPKLSFTDVGLILLILAAFTGLILSFPGRLVWSSLSRAEMFTILSYATYSGIKSPVVEEMLFRGLLFRVYKNYWGKAVAILLTSLVFTLPHIPNNLNPQEYLLSFSGYFAISLLLAFLRLHDGHVWGCVLLHSVWNVLVGHAFIVKIDAEIRSAFFTYLIDPSLVNDQQRLKVHLGQICILLLATAFVLAALYIKKRKANQRA